MLAFAIHFGIINIFIAVRQFGSIYSALSLSRQPLAVIMEKNSTQIDNYVGLDHAQTTFILRTQDKPDLCWVAGIQMLLANENITLTPEQIFSQILDIKFINDKCDRRISGEEIGNLLKNIRIQNGKTYKLNVTEYSNQISDENILTALERKKPVMASYNKLDSSSIRNSTYGHIVIISGANYFIKNDTKTISKLILLDPENEIDSVIQTYEKKEMQNILDCINVLWTIDLV